MCQWLYILFILFYLLLSIIHYKIYYWMTEAWREKGSDMIQSYVKSLITHRKPQNSTKHHTNATKNFDYTTTSDG